MCYSGDRCAESSIFTQAGFWVGAHSFNWCVQAGKPQWVTAPNTVLHLLLKDLCSISSKVIKGMLCFRHIWCLNLLSFCLLLSDILNGSAVCVYRMEDVVRAFKGNFLHKEGPQYKWAEFTGKVPYPRPGTVSSYSKLVDTTAISPGDFLYFSKSKCVIYQGNTLQ